MLLIQNFLRISSIQVKKHPDFYWRCLDLGNTFSGSFYRKTSNFLLIVINLNDATIVLYTPIVLALPLPFYQIFTNRIPHLVSNFKHEILWYLFIYTDDQPCVDNSESYMHGETWRRGPCENCECIRGTVACLLQPCVRVACELEPVIVEGDCCPSCPGGKVREVGVWEVVRFSLHKPFWVPPQWWKKPPLISLTIRYSPPDFCLKGRYNSGYYLYFIELLSWQNCSAEIFA